MIFRKARFSSLTSYLHIQVSKGGNWLICSIFLRFRQIPLAFVVVIFCVKHVLNYYDFFFA